MEDNLSVRINVPQADHARLSFCASEASAVADWVSQLPMANTAQAAQDIITAAQEVGRLACDGQTRLAMLEHLRPPLHYICTRLDRAALKNSSTQGDNIARVAQQLQTSLTTGYKAVVRDLLPKVLENKGGSGKGGAKDDLATAIHRSLSDISRAMLRTFQLYVTPPQNMWQELNQLFFLAEQLKIAENQVNDSENHSDQPITLTDAYLRPVMLSLSKPNQLRYDNLTRIFNALESWTSRINIGEVKGEELFAVDLAGNRGPTYARVLERSQRPRGISTDVLVYEVEAYLNEIDSRVPIPEYIDDSLLGHLVSAWGKMMKRSFKREEATGSIKVCVGLRSAHYFLSGGVPFADQVKNSETMIRRELNPFGDRDLQISFTGNTEKKDVWDTGRIPENPNIANPEQAIYSKAKGKSADDSASTFECYDTEAVDTSPGGYCVRWLKSIPATLQTGELIALRDESDPRWCIAVVRWIRQDQEECTMGIELLAPRAIPIACRVIQKKGGPTDYARALLLPELKPINQPATLITPRLPFAPDQKIHIQRQGVQTTAQLSERALQTESFNQFTFRMLDGYLENAQFDLNIRSLSELIGAEEPDAPK